MEFSKEEIEIMKGALVESIGSNNHRITFYESVEGVTDAAKRRKAALLAVRDDKERLLAKLTLAN